MEISSITTSFRAGATLLKRAENQIAASAEKSADEAEAVTTQIALLSAEHVAQSAGAVIRTADQMTGTLLDMRA